jgi:hypothetical protein
MQRSCPCLLILVMVLHNGSKQGQQGPFHKIHNGGSVCIKEDSLQNKEDSIMAKNSSPICILGSFWTFISFLIYFRAALLRFREKICISKFYNDPLTPKPLTIKHLNWISWKVANISQVN